MQVQERGGLSVPLVSWMDWEGGPGPLSPPPHQPFLALAVHPVYAKSGCEAISILRLSSVPAMGKMGSSAQLLLKSEWSPEQQ